MQPYDFENSVTYWVVPTAHALERALNEELTPHGITYSQCQVLAWLALVDSGRYAASLDSAAPLLREMITSPEQWAEFLAVSREGFTVLRRELLIAELDPSLPVVPPGRYIRLTFRITSRKSEATESVVLQAQPTGWRVAMYGVQNNS